VKLEVVIKVRYMGAIRGYFLSSIVLQEECFAAAFRKWLSRARAGGRDIPASDGALGTSLLNLRSYPKVDLNASIKAPPYILSIHPYRESQLHPKSSYPI
jgi:hypothetical protein